MIVRRSNVPLGGARPDELVRQPARFRDWVSADGSTGYAAQPGRYHLYVSHACPWASQAVLARTLKRLQDVVSMSAVDPIRDATGWAFRDVPGAGADPVNGFSLLLEAYRATDLQYHGQINVPVLWDRERRRIVNNDTTDIVRILNSEFDEWGDRSVDLYPVELRDEIDALNRRISRDLENGVHRAGFATTQEAYEQRFDALFQALDWLERILAGRRYLTGDTITEADCRLFTALVRFDSVYHGLFKCNLRRLVDYPSLWAYTRDLYQQPGVADTVVMDHIKSHYYVTNPGVNPTRIVPKGPELDFLAPTGRQALGDGDR